MQNATYSPARDARSTANIHSIEFESAPGTSHLPEKEAIVKAKKHALTNNIPALLINFGEKKPRSNHQPQGAMVRMVNLEMLQESTGIVIPFENICRSLGDNFVIIRMHA